MGRQKIEYSREYLIKVYKEQGNTRAAAKYLGIAQNTFMRLMKEKDIPAKRQIWEFEL